MERFRIACIYEYYIIKCIPTDLQNVIADTTVVSGYGSLDTENFVTTDKIYPLSTQETIKNFTNDTSAETSRQLDYYAEQEVDWYYGKNFAKLGKLYEGYDTIWWTRSTTANEYISMITLNNNGWLTSNTYTVKGISPAFRIK